MDALSFQKLYPREYLQKFLRMEVRPDGRRLLKVRPTSVSKGPITSSYGSSFAQIGDTSIVVAIKGEVGPPPTHTEHQNHQIVVNVELKPMCSPSFEGGKPGELAQSVGYRLNQLLVGPSGFVDLSTLCIESGKMLWYLYADIYCLNYDGNIFDTCLIGLVAALQDVRLPTAAYTEDSQLGIPSVRVTSKRDIPLTLKYTPVPLSFIVFDGGYIVADPTAEEETLSTSEVTIVMNESKKICSIYKPGGDPLGEKEMKTCMAATLDRLEDMLPVYHKE